MSLIALCSCTVTTRWVHIRVDEDLHERMKAAAAADRRSLANWVAVACERAMDAITAPAQPRADEAGR
jgi:uncharacterized protein (DUF1778 family)